MPETPQKSVQIIMQSPVIGGNDIPVNKTTLILPLMI
jgi:hypothetical protein